MIYSAVVLDNENFYTKGVITVRVARHYNAPMLWDMSDNKVIMEEFKALKKQGKVEDYDNCLISSPMGSGRNYGMFFLPQVNSIGTVTFLDNSFSRPLWLGGFFRPIRSEKDSNNKRIVDFVNIPNDDITKEGQDTDGSKGEIGGKQTTADEAAMIIRTKSTDNENYDWEEQDTENIIVLDKDRIKIVHFLTWESGVAKKYQTIEIIGASGEVKLSSINETDDTQTDFSVKDDNFDLKVTTGTEETGIEGKGGADNVVKIRKGSNTKVILSETEVSLTASGPVRISGTPVYLGNLGAKVVVTDSDSIKSLTDLKVSTIKV